MSSGSTKTFGHGGRRVGAGRKVGSIVAATPSERRAVADLAKNYTHDALKTLVAIMEDDEKPASARVSAATAILDRAWGKPAQTADVTVNTESHDQVMLRLQDAIREADGLPPLTKAGEQAH
jgi:hypothetical protein